MMAANFSTTQETTQVQGAVLPICKILVPLDAAPLAEEALPVALACAKRAGAKARLILLHVSRVEVAVSACGGSEAPSAAQPQAAYLGGIAQRMKDEGVEVEVIDMEGDPASAIVDLAREHHMDLIVLVTHAHDGLRRLLYGSVADRVLQAASVPVLVIITKRISARTDDTR